MQRLVLLQDEIGEVRSCSHSWIDHYACMLTTFAIEEIHTLFCCRSASNSAFTSLISLPLLFPVQQRTAYKSQSGIEANNDIHDLIFIRKLLANGPNLIQAIWDNFSLSEKKKEKRTSYFSTFLDMSTLSNQTLGYIVRLYIFPIVEKFNKNRRRSSYRSSLYHSR